MYENLEENASLREQYSEVASKALQSVYQQSQDILTLRLS